MTVESEVVRKTYAGDSVTVSFGTSPMVFFDSADLDVTVVDNDTGAVEELDEGTDYTVTGGDGDTGTISTSGLYGAIPTGFTLVIMRDLPVTQEYDPENNDGSDAEALEEALDRVVMIAQQLDMRVGFTVKLADDDISGADLTLPTPSAGELIGWNEDGDGLANYVVSTIVTDTSVLPAFWVTELATTSAANARAGLGVSATTDTVLKSLFTAKGSLLTATASATPSELAVGANGRIPMARSADSKGIAWVPALAGCINGWTYANGSDATNDIDIAAGGGMDSTDAYWMSSSALTKRSDAAWTVGTGNGWLDTGVIGNAYYYIWMIARSDTGVVDSLLSLSASSPTMPANYDFKRLIGWIVRESGAIVAFKTYEMSGGGIEYLRVTPSVSQIVNLGASRVLSGNNNGGWPDDFSVEAHVRVVSLDAGTGFFVIVQCPDETDAAPSGTATPGASQIGTGANLAGVFEGWVRTNSSGELAYRAVGTTVDTVTTTHIGWRWSRRR